MTNCKNCNAILVDLFNFCPYCGELSPEGIKRREKSRIAYEYQRTQEAAHRARVLQETLLTLRRNFEKSQEIQIKTFHIESQKADRRWQAQYNLINCPRVFIVPELPPCDHKDCNLDADYSVIASDDQPIDKFFYCEKHALDLLLGSAAIGDDSAARSMRRLVLGTEL